YQMMTERQLADYERDLEMNLGLSVSGVGRFRVNVFQQRGEVSMVIRYVKNEIPSIEDLGLPQILKNFAMVKRGLVLMVGATGSGKSTSLAAMIDFRNNNAPGHILTVEDPIEFLHKHKRSVVNQREIGFDTHNYHNALVNALREAPDVILIGEIRDRETMESAIKYAETGHLCLSTLHSNNANQTLDRIVNFFPDTAHRQLLLDLSLNLRGIVSQRLIPGKDGQKRVAAVEVMMNTPYIAQLIQEGQIPEIKNIMGKGTDQGMQTFDQALYDLYSEGKITLEDALENSDSRNDLALRIRMAGGPNVARGDF
ncbi:MAG: PilT/PilU family type 4a pilus ATPase, partial [Proteobacteria bacterium]